MDIINIKRLPVKCIIGVFEQERKKKQIVYVSIDIYVNVVKAGRSDKLEDTVDYAEIIKKIIATAEKTHYYLIEALAEKIASICLAEDKRVKKVVLSVEKKTTLPVPVTIEIKRTSKQNMKSGHKK